ncbi:MAG: ArsR/SmtB family transcription factor [Thermoplasmata archaeon]
MRLPSANFGILADPTRLRIVERLRAGERSVGSLVTSLSVCQPGVSRHLRILHNAGFVRVRAEGQRRLYSLRREPFRELDAWVHEYRDLVEARLDRLEKLVEAESSDSRSALHSMRRM